MLYALVGSLLCLIGVFCILHGEVNIKITHVNRVELSEDAKVAKQASEAINEETKQQIRDMTSALQQMMGVVDHE